MPMAFEQGSIWHSGMAQRETGILPQTIPRPHAGGNQ
jgi:hypothetical protein